MNAHSLVKAAFVLAVTLAAASPVAAQTGAGTVTHLSGTLSVVRGGGMRVLGVNSVVNEGDLLTTERETYARIKFTDDSEVVLRPNSQLQLSRYQFDAAEPARDNMLLSMIKGGLRAVTGAIGKRNRDRVGVQTPTATIGIRGTHFGLLFCQGGNCIGIPSSGGRPLADGLHIDLANGQIAVTNNAGTLLLNAGQFGYVPAPNQAPRVVPPEAGLRVTMPGAISTSIASRGVGIGANHDDACVMQ